jgi:NTE family protein
LKGEVRSVRLHGGLERLLDTPELRIEVLSGASAGAMNAAMVTQGLSVGGPEAAKEQLERFWRRVAIDAHLLAPSFGGWAEFVHRLMSPLVASMQRSGVSYMLPKGRNPLKVILQDVLDTGAFRRAEAPRIVVSATSVRTGEGKLFTNDQITVDTLLASSCLPMLFPPVFIEGEAYWDGGFSANPPIQPLIEAGAPSDVIVVRTTPLQRPPVPLTTREITDRTNELAFGTGLRDELRSLVVTQRSLRHIPIGATTLRRLRDVRLHMIGADAEFMSLPAGSHLDIAGSFLARMRSLGNEAANDWLGQNLKFVGERSTVPTSLFEGPRLPDFEQDNTAAFLQHSAHS